MSWREPFTFLTPVCRLFDCWSQTARMKKLQIVLVSVERTRSKSRANRVLCGCPVQNIGYGGTGESPGVRSLVLLFLLLLFAFVVFFPRFGFGCPNPRLHVAQTKSTSEVVVALAFYGRSGPCHVTTHPSQTVSRSAFPFVQSCAADSRTRFDIDTGIPGTGFRWSGRSGSDRSARTDHCNLCKKLECWYS